ncbi:MAG: adenine phosphoribosyltransferase [Balneola sp.]|jgi:adenine phosphoribosyltransferase|nr:adenine phosphoribosyltransferase [Balneola sp.]MBE79597.1 adenine phosphoribosyltransferase [Balneola sp.]|tara:strand:+ start:2085 stop:2627 length:543 start_codon:yes stop_codon:yes gene_type:complete
MKKVEQSIIDFISETIRTVPDFPKEGIQFKDITTLLQDKQALELTSYMLEKPFIGEHVDFVVGLESRGFLFGTNLAQDLHAGFVPVRKPGKLPAKSISETYALEYGEDSIEMHEDAIFEGAKVIIHDDLIATGGSAAAASKLVQRLGGEVIGYSFIIELSFLNGREKLIPNVPVESILIE